MTGSRLSYVGGAQDLIGILPKEQTKTEEDDKKRKKKSTDVGGGKSMRRRRRNGRKVSL